MKKIEFGYKKGAFGQMLRRGALPSVEVVQSICNFYSITIDDFVNRPLTEKSFNRETILTTVDERETYGAEPSKYTELLEKSLADKELIISTLQEKLARYEVGTSQGGGPSNSH